MNPTEDMTGQRAKAATNRPTCETCPFWDRHIRDDKGYCRRIPPTRQGPDSCCPETYMSEWCGLHPDFKAYIDELKKPARCEEMFRGAQCSLAAGHPGVHNHDLGEIPPWVARCTSFTGGGQCVKEFGHAGDHAWPTQD